MSMMHFLVSHRAHASIDGITKYLPSYFGLQITEEINALKKNNFRNKKSNNAYHWRFENFN